jgi:hypothetical protein
MRHIRNRSVAAFCGAIALTLAGTVAGAPVSASQKPRAGIVVSGCLGESTATPGLFLIANAVVKGSADKPQTFKLVPGMEDPDFASRKGHHVELTGAVEAKTVPAGKVADKDLPAFTVTAITDVAPSCSGR